MTEDGTTPSLRPRCLEILVALHSDDPSDIAAVLPDGRGSVLVYVGNDADLLADSVIALRPAVLLASVNALGANQVGIVRKMAESAAPPTIFVFQPGPGDVRAAGLLEAGCRAILVASMGDVLSMLGSLMPRHGPLLGGAAPLEQAATGRSQAQLTRRETAVLRAMAQGHTNIRIARELGLSVETVKTHARRIFRALSALDRAHAVAIAMRAGLLLDEPPSHRQGGDPP